MTYLYDYENHLVKTTYADGSKNWFTYTGDGIRYTKRDSAGPVRFVYDGIDVLQEIDLVTGSTSANYLQGFGGLIKQRRSSTDRWYQYDGLGSARALTNSSETVTDTYSYEAFGNLLSSSGSTVNPYRYVGGWGYYRDPDSDLMLLTARYYDSDVGRFITKDPILVTQSNPQALNLYVYCGNSPLVRVDADGTLWKELKYWSSVAVPTVIGVALGGVDILVTAPLALIGVTDWAKPRIMHRGQEIDGFPLEASYLCFEGGILNSAIRAGRGDEAFTVAGTTPVVFAPKGLSGQVHRHESIHVWQGQQHRWLSYWYGIKYGSAYELEAYLGAGQYAHKYVQRRSTAVSSRPKHIGGRFWNETTALEASKVLHLGSSVNDP